MDRRPWLCLTAVPSVVSRGCVDVVNSSARLMCHFKWFFHSLKTQLLDAGLSFIKISNLLCFVDLFFLSLCYADETDSCVCFIATRWCTEMKTLLFSLLVGGGVSVVRKGGGGASRVRQSGPAADCRPMPRYFGTSRQCSGRQLLTHTHTHTEKHIHVSNK